jgi:hypothetical protein
MGTKMGHGVKWPGRTGGARGASRGLPLLKSFVLCIFIFTLIFIIF